MSDIDKVLDDARKRLERGQEPANVAGILRGYCPEELDILAYRLDHQSSGCTSKGDVYMLIDLIEKSTQVDKEAADGSNK